MLKGVKSGMCKRNKLYFRLQYTRYSDIEKGSIFIYFNSRANKTK